MTEQIDNRPIAILSDIATDTHTRIQQDFKNLDPIVGISQNMRDEGFPADLMTIDCLKTNKRIILMVHDQMPGLLHYQFAFRNKEPEQAFQQMDFDDLTRGMLYDWIKDYFQEAAE